VTKIKGQTNVDRDDFSGYVDNGCGKLCVRSLDCPFKFCVLDKPRHLSEPVTDDKAIVDMLKGGARIAETARFFKTSPRTVYRARRRAALAAAS
jgi:transposase-like protein